MSMIRPEAGADHASVHELNVAAFDGTVEARLVDMLRDQARPVVSLVAEDDGVVVGHIMFSPVSLPGFARLMMGLAPMAVTPSRQRRGIGSALVKAGLQRSRELGAVAAVVLGHPDFYPRFGFVSAARFGLQCEYDVPLEAFTALELEANALLGAAGKVSYHPVFGNL
jgi:putative acetyltransferase